MASLVEAIAAAEDASSTSRGIEEDVDADVDAEIDMERIEQQQIEFQVLDAMYPDRMELISGRRYEDTEHEKYYDLDNFQLPIACRIPLTTIAFETETETQPGKEQNNNDNNNTKIPITTTNWPEHPLTLEVHYPSKYPSAPEDEEEEGSIEMDDVIPTFVLVHDNTVQEFPSHVSEQLVTILTEQAKLDQGRLCMIECLLQANQYLHQPREWDDTATTATSITANKGIITTTSHSNAEKKKNVIHGTAEPKRTTTAKTTTTTTTINKNTTTATACTSGSSGSSSIKYGCISTHHLLDHKPDNILRKGLKYNVSGYYKFGTPGIGVMWGEQVNIEAFVSTLKQTMPQKKIETIFLRSWDNTKHTTTTEERPKGWKLVTSPAMLRTELSNILGIASDDDYYTILGIHNKNSDKNNKKKDDQQNDNNNNNNNNRSKRKGKKIKK